MEVAAQPGPSHWFPVKPEIRELPLMGESDQCPEWVSPGEQGVGVGSGGRGRPADGWGCMDAVVAPRHAPPRWGISPEIPGCWHEFVQVLHCVFIGIKKIPTGYQYSTSLPRVSAEERGGSASPAVWVPHLQPAHTHAEGEVGFLAAEGGLHEPLPAPPVTRVGSASRRAPGSGLGRCSAALRCRGSARPLASAPGLACSGSCRHTGFLFSLCYQ